MNVLILFESKFHTLNILHCLAEAGVNCYVFGTGSSWDIRLSKYCREFVKCEWVFFINSSVERVEEINIVSAAR